MYKFSRLSLKIFFTALPAIWLYVIASVYVYDPLQIWHKPFFRKTTYSGNARESMPAIVRDYDFDGIIIGNSYSENTSAAEASEKLGAKFMNLSVTGATTYENKMLTEYVFKRKEIKRVLYFLETSYLEQIKENESYPLSQYAFLYDDNKFNDFKIYMNFKYLQGSLFFSNNKNYIGIERDMDAPYAWYGGSKKFFGGFDNWIKHKNDWRIDEILRELSKTQDKVCAGGLSDEDKNKIAAFFEENLMPPVIDNPQIRFFLVLPPVSDMWLALQLRNGNKFFEKRMFALEHLASLSEKYGNFRFFAFDDLDIIGKTEDFKDLTHYAPWVNSYILTSVKENKNLITPENAGAYIEKAYKKAAEFKLDEYVKTARGILNSNKK